MSIDRKNADVNHQDHLTRKGSKITRLQIMNDGQRCSNTQKQSMSNMMNESKEQKAGPAHGQKDENDI